MGCCVSADSEYKLVDLRGYGYTTEPQIIVNESYRMKKSMDAGKNAIMIRIYASNYCRPAKLSGYTFVGGSGGSDCSYRYRDWRYIRKPPPEYQATAPPKDGQPADDIV